MGRPKMGRRRQKTNLNLSSSLYRVKKLLISRVDELQRWLADLGDTVCIDIETDGC
jgi:hypothetical protein